MTLRGPCLRGAASEHYDLGGPCIETQEPGTLGQIWQAKKNGSWDRVIELEKQNVRTGCHIAWRWFELVNALLEAQRPTEALQVLEEVDARGFELNPSLLGREHRQLIDFMATPLFQASSVGKKVEQLKKISDERRAYYRHVLAALPANQKPPERYVAQGACPFECCQYRDWTVLQNTTLMARPGSHQIVGQALRGSRVIALTGEVHLQPEPVAVLVDGELPKGSIAFVLDYEGEGYGHVYTRGKVISVALNYAKYCFRLSDSCWGETLEPAARRTPPVWWVKVKLANGTVGWTEQTGHFGNQDACG